MFIVDGREEVASENKALCSLTQLALRCAAYKWKMKEEVEEAFVDLSKSWGRVSTLDDYQQELE